MLYGLSDFGLARRLSLTLAGGRELLQIHKEVFRKFWAWSDAVEMEAFLYDRLETVFGWQVNVPGGFDPKTRKPIANPRSLRNFPMQAHGAEMMRLACCLATEAGIRVAAVVHDALLVEAPEEEIEDVADRTMNFMREASEIVLPRFPLRAETNIIRYPDRYTDPRGKDTWEAVGRLLRAYPDNL
jgi:DNA polymerase I-like protein with 3'-5' exonuclease and polymerase domains